jgi:hypothetical protein
VVMVSVCRQHRQVIQYIAPHEHEKLSQVRHDWDRDGKGRRRGGMTMRRRRRRRRK